MYQPYQHQPSSSRLPSGLPMSPQRFQRSQAQGSNLRLPSLPKFHPATYVSSTESSLSTTPSSNASSPGNPQAAQPFAPAAPSPMSPQRRQYSEAQRQLLMYQRDLISSRAPRSPGARSPRPASPHLQPLGSPGPVTPLELEEEAGGYLLAGATSGLSESAKEQILDVFIQKETKGSVASKRRREDGSYGHSRESSAGGSAGFEIR